MISTIDESARAVDRAVNVPASDQPIVEAVVDIVEPNHTAIPAIRRSTIDETTWAVNADVVEVVPADLSGPAIDVAPIDVFVTDVNVVIPTNHRTRHVIAPRTRRHIDSISSSHAHLGAVRAVGHCDAVWAAEVHEVRVLSIVVFGIGLGIGGVARSVAGAVSVRSIGGLELEVVIVGNVVTRDGLLGRLRCLV